MKTLRICGLVLLTISILAGCSGPIFGSDVENFAEYEKTGTVPLPDGIAKMIYLQRGTHPNANSRSNGLFLVIRDMADDTEELIFEGHGSYSLQDLIVDTENLVVYYVISDYDDYLSKYYLVAFDLKTMQEMHQTVILDTTELEDSTVAGMLFDGSFERIAFEIRCNLDENDHYRQGREYRLFDVQTQTLQVIDPSTHYENLFAAYYQGWGINNRLYSVYLYEGPLDLHNSYYKPKYAGIYVDNGVNNIRVSTTYRELGPYFWFEDESYVISGAYLYDASGTTYERQLIDERGTVLAVWGSAVPKCMGGFVW